MVMNGVKPEPLHGMLFDQFATAAQAAIAGIGIALLPKFLIEEELSTGKLVRALDIEMRSAESYFLVWPPDRATHPPLLAFRQWILAETMADR